MSNIQLLNKDCMEVMASCPDGYFDLAIVDPPYFSGPEKRKYYGKEVSSHGVKRINYEPLNDSWMVPNEKYFLELERVSKEQIVWGANYYDYNFKSSGTIIWDKVNGQSSFSDAEIANCSLIKHVRMFRYMWAGMMQGMGDGTCDKMQGNKNLNEKKIHPTQKPVALYKWLLEKFAKQGFKILDTHLGSGSSAIACHDYGYELVGCEINSGYYEAAVKRFNLVTSQQSLFAAS